MPIRIRRWTSARRLCLAVAVASWAGLGSTAAQSGPSGDLLDMPFEELLQVQIRTAGKREEQIRDIPASVTIVTRDDIERYGWVTFEDLLRNVPGFSFSRSRS
jgi:outer membrane receptor protein involved in Fe transport